MARDRPGRSPNARSTPAVMSGKVIPSRTDCGRISAVERPHLNADTAAGDPASRGSTASYARPVAAAKTSWNTSPSRPMAPSVKA